MKLFTRLGASLLVVASLAVPAIQMTNSLNAGPKIAAVDDGDIMRRPGGKKPKPPKKPKGFNYKKWCWVQVSPRWNGSFARRLFWNPKYMLNEMGLPEGNKGIQRFLDYCAHRIKVQKVDPSGPNNGSSDVMLTLTNGCVGKFDELIHRSDWRRVHLIVP